MSKIKQKKWPAAAKWLLATLALAGGGAGLTCSCSAAYPVEGAMIAGTAAAFTFPLAVPLAIPAGYGIGLMAQNEANGDAAQVQLDNIEAKVDAITTGDVEALVAMGLENAANKPDGVINKATAAIYSFLKLAFALVVLMIIGVLGYVLYRKRTAQKFYKMLGGDA